MTLTTSPFDDDHLHEECGVFGIFGTPDAAAHTALGLHALQHRGQEATGIVATDGEHFNAHRGLGHVGENFGADAQNTVAKLTGFAAIGHNRYATTGETAIRNVQPLFADFEFGGFALCHNGNLTNALILRQQLVRQGCIFQSTTDTETIVHLIARSRRRTVVDRLIEAMNQVDGAYALVCLSSSALIGLRDPNGVRPLILGRLGDSYIITSESCALDIIGADFVRDVEPGELLVIDGTGLKSYFPFRPAERRFCIFEYIYFARPDSLVEGISVYAARKAIGAELAKESGVEADVVVPVPDSGVPAAVGYAAAAGIPFELGIIRNHYVGRTFIQPTDQVRHLGVKLKHNANRAQLAGKRVILVDDSIVRGTTSTKIVEMVRQAGAREVHMRIASPPTTHSCFYGVDTPEREKLLAARMSVEEMARVIGVDSLAFISIDGLYRAMGEPRRDPEAIQYCDACFTGDYPIALTDRDGGNAARQLSLLAEAS
ncbi:amidophosphoribosyltransferase [Thalassobaculum fulvum]|jgi:amidophosphoribosyltransferase|uniref:Amidophosphoribosyltransferase n=1 Tax=Thalassobaculum fulvum TaxID=1633335 RepID=A0A918XS93_9PROT|nr:amidophosphoribosyltransferase [Thalassobaculum fulvum]GHD49760.1 amidophosphoribosyltransferase [Thalassobaculum fulvum]